jgi:hypothetical protein
MTDRERLKELIDKSFAEQYEKRGLLTAQHTADYLIANGVIVPPCKVGDTVWFNTFKQNATVCVGIQPHTVDRIDVIYVCDTKNLIETEIASWEIGKGVFLTKEEAEAKLKEREGK